MIKTFGTALALDNLAAIKQIVKDVSVDPNKRSTNDEEVLTLATFLNARKGLECPVKTVNYFIDEFGVKITKLEYGDGSSNYDANDLIYCGKTLLNSYNNFQDRQLLLTYINNSAISTLKHDDGSKTDSEKIAKLKPILAKANEEIDSACKASTTSNLCLFKEQFQEIEKNVKKLSKK